MDAATFLIQFPEFGGDGGATTGLINAMLAAAALEIDPTFWGTKADQGLAYLAAHKLVVSPWGQAARLETNGGVSTYMVEYKRLKGLVSVGPRVVTG